MAALETKLVRDLRRLLGQALTIALVVACGIASYVTLRSAYGSLLSARDRYYASSRFADVFAHLKRAPESLSSRVAAIEGVEAVETRLVEPLLVPIEGQSEPATGRLISLPAGGEPRLNAPVLRSGRAIDPTHPDEALLLETFASAHGIEPGDRLTVVMNGVERRLSVVGTVISPEYVVSAGAPGEEFAPDDRRFTAVFMDRDAVAPAFDMAGAFDDVCLRLQPGASEQRVRGELDTLLAPYGGTSSVARARQPSAFLVDNELSQLEAYATVAPALFLGVTAFLVNVVLSRLVRLQRSQIATLKALGYSRARVGLHFLELVMLIVAVGAVFGVGLGVWLGRGMLTLYAPYFRFQSLDYVFEPGVAATAVLVSAAAAASGALGVVISVAGLPPAEAMQPEPPPTYGSSLVERLGLDRLLSTGGRMVLRELTRRPLRLLLSVAGIASGMSVVLVGMFTFGAFEVIVDLGFEAAQREDTSVVFAQPMPASALHELERLPGVIAAEPLRTVAVRLRAGHVAHDTALIGHPRAAELRRVIEWPWRVVPVPDDGLLLSDPLARKLGVGVGDEVVVEFLEGDRRARKVRVSSLAAEVFGMSAHVDIDALHGLMGEERSISAALLRVDSAHEDLVDGRLKRLPQVISVGKRRSVIQQFKRQIAESMEVTSLVMTLFGCAIAVAVVYNNARIALSVRERDLSTLRVLGFTRAEISSVLLGELAVQVALAIPPGLWLGKQLAAFMMSTVNAEMLRLPVIISGPTYAAAALVTVVAAMGSGLAVKGKLDALDPISALKARE